MPCLGWGAVDAESRQAAVEVGSSTPEAEADSRTPEVVADTGTVEPAIRRIEPPEGAGGRVQAVVPLTPLLRVAGRRIVLLEVDRGTLDLAEGI